MRGTIGFPRSMVMLMRNGRMLARGSVVKFVGFLPLVRTNTKDTSSRAERSINHDQGEDCSHNPHAHPSRENIPMNYMPQITETQLSDLGDRRGKHVISNALWLRRLEVPNPVAVDEDGALTGYVPEVGSRRSLPGSGGCMHSEDQSPQMRWLRVKPRRTKTTFFAQVRRGLISRDTATAIG